MAIELFLPLATLLSNWQQVSKRLAESRRQRKLPLALLFGKIKNTGPTCWSIWYAVPWSGSMAAASLCAVLPRSLLTRCSGLRHSLSPS